MVRSKRLYQFLGQKRVAIAEACLIGLVSGLSAVVLKQGIEVLTDWRLSNPFALWWLLPLLGLVAGGLSGWLVERFSPEMSGSGIPQVKAALGYVPMPLNLQAALIKLLSTTLALGAGLSLGRQGPTVQIGAALAAQLSRWVPTSPEYRRQLISAGAAAGLAAGFNAPISGVLFVVEELLQDFSGLTLGTAILASFVGAVVSRLLGGQGLNLGDMGLLQTGLSVQDLPFLVLLGLLAGGLGGVFSQGLFTSLKNFRRFKSLSLTARVGLVGFVTGVVGVWLGVAAQDNTSLWEFLVTESASWQFITIAFISKFCLTLLAYGSGAPGGIFAPALVLGAALGCLVNLWAQAVHGWVGLPVGTLESSNTTTYALTGMGAFFSAVTRVPITAIVIVFEMTANFNLVLPLMIGSGVAYLISDRIATGSLYNRLLVFRGIHLNPAPSENNPWAHLTAADLMQRRVETLSAGMTLQEAREAFSRSHHRGFPVLAQGKLVGIVTQSDLGNFSQSTVDLTLMEVMTPYPVTVSPDAPLSQVLHLLNRLKISRLPVTQGSKLVGIITRGDIIRAESEQISGKTQEAGTSLDPSYRVYAMRSPATGCGRLLVPLSDPESAPLLLSMAAAIARQRQYELECVHIIKVPLNVPTDEASVDLSPGKQLLAQAETLVEHSGLPVHTQIRVAHDVGRALLEVIKKRHIDLVLMGWRRQPRTPGRVLGNIVDTLLRQAPCPLVLVRPGDNQPLNRWLIPVVGGPNAQLAMSLLPALMSLSEEPSVRLCSIARSPEEKEPLGQRLRAMAQTLETRLTLTVKTRLLTSANVAEAVVHLSRQHDSDVIMVGASREGLFSHVIKGNIPLEIAQSSRATLILVQQNGPQATE